MKTVWKILSYVLTAVVAASVTMVVMASLFMFNGNYTVSNGGLSGEYSKLEELKALIQEQ